MGCRCPGCRKKITAKLTSLRIQIHLLLSPWSTTVSTRRVMMKTTTTILDENCTTIQPPRDSWNRTKATILIIRTPIDAIIAFQLQPTIIYVQVNAAEVGETVLYIQFLRAAEWKKRASRRREFEQRDLAVAAEVKTMQRRAEDELNRTTRYTYPIAFDNQTAKKSRAGASRVTNRENKLWIVRGSVTKRMENPKPIDRCANINAHEMMRLTNQPRS